MKDLVEDFIDRRFRHDSANLHWLNGNCLWFAIILQTRFPGGEIFYLPVPGHFVYKYDGKFYDWHGIIKPFEPIIPSISPFSTEKVTFLSAQNSFT